ncbi:hypothetical protein ACFY12_27430 [Streptomyces sp. NPDC001339]|uniref:effector-associated constant component EACC1 n=1 Tax=Streptomyces sp. NPDC001339 TaxID=3364563 RepID=UPI0036C64BF1
MFSMERRRSGESVHIRLGTSGAGDGEGERATLDFCAWLRQTPEVREYADISLRPAQQDDAETMGAVEIIDLVLGHGFAALNLALAYASWRGARPSAPAVTLTTSRGSVTVHGGSDEEIGRIVAALHGNAPDAPGADGPADTGGAGEDSSDRGSSGAR